MSMPSFLMAQEVVPMEGSAPVAPATQPSLNLNSDIDVYREVYESGKTIQNVGRFMSWGGLTASLFGNLTGNVALNTIGGLSLMVGIPVNGWGSSKMVKGVNGMDAKAQLDHRGWIPYGVGWGLVGYGFYSLLTGITEWEDEDDYYGESDSQDEAEQKMVTGAVAILVGQVCWFVAWYKFSDSADDADIFARRNIQLSAAPLFVPERNGNGFAKGMQLSARF